MYFIMFLIMVVVQIGDIEQSDRIKFHLETIAITLPFLVIVNSIVIWAELYLERKRSGKGD